VHRLLGQAQLGEDRADVLLHGRRREVQGRLRRPAVLRLAGRGCIGRACRCGSSRRFAIRPDSEPPAASQRCAAVWRSRWGRKPLTPARAARRRSERVSPSWPNRLPRLPSHRSGHPAGPKNGRSDRSCKSALSEVSRGCARHGTVNAGAALSQSF
jgi:hypothetical protein